MKKHHVQLTAEDREKLESMLSKGSLKARVYKRVQGLLELDSGKNYACVAPQVRLSRASLAKLSERYQLERLACLYDNPRSGRPIKITDEQRDKITILACEDAPKGHSQWSLRLLADKVVELGYCDSISHTQVDKILKKKKSNPT